MEKGKHMNLRNTTDEYNIGLDMGTNSVGWAVTDKVGAIAHFKGMPTLGSRLFDAAQTAAEARAHRGQRRRYVRRRWRLDLLQSLFQDEIDKVDSEFFIRLRQSRLHVEDREDGHADYKWPIFNDSDFTEVDYYKRFPTIYHLRKWLIETDQKADIRLIYLAVHNIVKHRGNFLRENNKNLSSRNADPAEAVGHLRLALNNWCLERGYECAWKSGGNDNAILNVLIDGEKRRSDQVREIAKLTGIDCGDAKQSRQCNEAIAKAIVGLKAEMKNIFGEFPAEKTLIYLSSDDDVEVVRDACPDDSVELFQALCELYAAYILQGLLSYAPGQTISVNMVKKYDRYGEDLHLLKELTRTYASKRYDAFFRGETYEGSSDYVVDKAQGYTRYNLGTTQLSYDDFQKAVKELFKGTDALQDERYQGMMVAFGEQRFLRRLKTSDNGSIYYQLHLEELHAILENQGKHYPFLLAEEDKIESLVSFRIPYYVGPLTRENAAVGHDGKERFAWSSRRDGMEHAVITPWNWEEIIDRDKSAEDFIIRMTGDCTYLQGEPVLPKCSLLYEEFCALNELNGAHWTIDEDDERRFDAAQRERIMCDLFRSTRKVTYKKVSDWLEREDSFVGARVHGGQGEHGFESQLGSYIFFCKDVFKTDSLDEADYPMIEQIILWSTLFEDRDILRRKIEEAYGDRLTTEQIKVICKKRFAGWGRLSKKLLTGIKVDTDTGRKSIIDVLREGNPNDGQRSRTMVFMEVLRDEGLGFQKAVDDFNRDYFSEHNNGLMDVNDLPGSPAIRRSINQAVRIVDEIVSIAKKEPANIFIEVTREEDDPRKKGKRTKRRYDAIKSALEVFKKDDPQLWKELTKKDSNNMDERLSLYFMQRGKCMYSGRPIKIEELHTGKYEVDHIIPRSYIKDDSLENKVLVYREENQHKTDTLLIDSSIRRKMGKYWRMLHNAKLIGDKKFRNLFRDHIDDKTMKGFVARQIVETSQMVKLVQTLLEARYPGARIVPVKANISHDLRDAAGLVKCREANDFHHAHDAFLACRVGLFIQKRHPSVYDNPIGLAHIMRDYARAQAREYKKSHYLAHTKGFIVNSFLSSGFDKETGEVFKDDWDAEAEVEGIRRVLNYRQCFISRMPVEATGTFWDQTIYSPKCGKKLTLPLKRGLDPDRYGSYSREQFAYFFIYEARDLKHERHILQFAQVPVRVAAHIAKDPSQLESYAVKLAGQANLAFVRIVRRRILKKQLLELNGDRLIITGVREVRNATEFAFSLDEETLIERCVQIAKVGSLIGVVNDEDEEQLSADLNELFSSLVKRGPKLCNRLYAQLKLDKYLSKFDELTLTDKAKVVLQLIAITNGSINMADLSALGSSKYAGCMQVSYFKQLNAPIGEVNIIDQSVTGMFERRTHIGL